MAGTMYCKLLEWSISRMSGPKAGMIEGMVSLLAVFLNGLSPICGRVNHSTTQKQQLLANFTAYKLTFVL